MRELSLEMQQSLECFGFTEEKIAQFGPQSDLLRHLRISGDDFDTFYQCLSESYGSQNRIPRHLIPSELSWDSFFIALGNILPFFDGFIRTPPLTLAMIDEMMRAPEGRED